MNLIFAEIGKMLLVEPYETVDERPSIAFVPSFPEFLVRSICCLSSACRDRWERKFR